jgi:transcriptional regulator with XRE-family HTH domain
MIVLEIMKFGASPSEIRAARSLLGWSQTELGRRAGISANGVSLIESGRVDPHVTTLQALVKALEEGGVEFIAGEDADGAGVGVSQRSRTGLHSLRCVGPISHKEAGLARLARALARIDDALKKVKGPAIHGDGETTGMLEILHLRIGQIIEGRESERLFENIAYAVETAFDLGRIEKGYGAKKGHKSRKRTD